MVLLVLVVGAAFSTSGRTHRIASGVSIRFLSLPSSSLPSFFLVNRNPENISPTAARMPRNLSQPFFFFYFKILSERLPQTYKPM
jgi:hypothetical protein